MLMHAKEFVALSVANRPRCPNSVHTVPFLLHPDQQRVCEFCFKISKSLLGEGQKNELRHLTLKKKSRTGRRFTAFYGYVRQFDEKFQFRIRLFSSYFAVGLNAELHESFRPLSYLNNLILYSTYVMCRNTLWGLLNRHKTLKGAFL